MITTVTTVTTTTVTTLALGGALGAMAMIALVMLLAAREYSTTGSGRTMRVLSSYFLVPILPLLVVFVFILLMRAASIL